MLPKFLWLICPFNYNENLELTRLVKEIIASDFIINREETYYTKIETENYKISFWNENKWYAWMQNGKVIRKNDDRVVFEWQRARPSKSVFHDFVKMYLEKRKIYLLENPRDNRIRNLLPL